MQIDLKGMDIETVRNKLRRVLVVRLDNIGDVVMLSPALRSLRGALPEADITLMASSAGSQVLPLLPWVDHVIVWRAAWQDISGALSFDAARELRLVEELRRRQFDAALIFTSFSQSPYPPAYACYLAEIPIRLGQSKDFGGSIMSHWQKPPADEGHQVDRNLALLELGGFPIHGRHLELQVPADVQSRADRILEAAGVDPDRLFILLAPGASCAARRYDPARFAIVARKLVSATGLPLVVVGSEREAETLAPVLEAAGEKPTAEKTNSERRLNGHGQVISLVGQTSVPELAGIVRRAGLVIANNSACLHLADAFCCPMVILYSGTEFESQWMPLSAPAILLRRYTECSPCYNFHCPYQMECLDIPENEVVRAALELLVKSVAVKSISEERHYHAQAEAIETLATNGREN